MDENIENAQKRDSLNSERFHFRKNIFPKQPDASKISALQSVSPDFISRDDYSLMTVNEIINGGPSFIGFIPLINTFLQSLEIDIETSAYLNRYLNFISLKAKGEILTTASWIRQFVQKSPLYKQDSVISQELNYELLKRMCEISEGKVHEPLLFGNIQ